MHRQKTYVHPGGGCHENVGKNLHRHLHQKSLWKYCQTWSGNCPLFLRLYWRMHHSQTVSRAERLEVLLFQMCHSDAASPGLKGRHRLCTGAYMCVHCVRMYAKCPQVRTFLDKQTCTYSLWQTNKQQFTHMRWRTPRCSVYYFWKIMTAPWIEGVHLWYHIVATAAILRGKTNGLTY